MKKTKANLMYKCKIFDVWEEEVPLPTGKSIKQSWIDHKPTVAIVALNNKNELLLIKQYRLAVKKHLLEIPAGSLKDSTMVTNAAAKQQALQEAARLRAKHCVNATCC